MAEDILFTGQTYSLRRRATVTLNGAVIADNIPIVSGREEYDGSLSVPERVSGCIFSSVSTSVRMESTGLTEANF